MPMDPMLFPASVEENAQRTTMKRVNAPSACWTLDTMTKGSLVVLLEDGWGLTILDANNNTVTESSDVSPANAPAFASSLSHRQTISDISISIHS